MDFGGHINFDHGIDHGIDDDVDDAGLFADTTDHDFSLPPTQPTINPQSIQATRHPARQSGGITNASGFGQGASRHREPTAQPEPAGPSQRRVISPGQRRSVGSGISKPRATQQTASAPVSGSLRRSLQETLNRASSVQSLESQVAALQARLQAFEDRLSQIEVDAHRTQDDLKVCMSEVNGALEFAESFNYWIVAHS
ncbi:hypothetical protein LTS08_008769 [Lithohypha guttulata]|nr:hypothetical protein LTS08_008769 [Lithohypha guttulata]